MIKLKDLISEGKFQMKGKYLYMPTGEVSSIPSTYEPDSIIVSIKRDEFKIYHDKKGIYVIGSRYDKHFKNGNDLAKWLNKSKAKYLGIDRR